MYRRPAILAVGLSLLCIPSALMLPRVRPQDAAAKRDAAAAERVPEPVLAEPL